VSSEPSTNPHSEPLDVATVIPETVIRTIPDGTARQRFISVQETRREADQVHPSTLDELEEQFGTRPNLQTLSESRVEQLSQNTLQNPDTSSKHKAFTPTISYGLHDVNTSWSRSCECSPRQPRPIGPVTLTSQSLTMLYVLEPSSRHHLMS
jgi:hypothetical protein